MDQCTHCLCRGDLDKCLQADCSQHESWFGKLHLDKCAELEPEPCPRCAELEDYIENFKREALGIIVGLHSTLDNMDLDLAKEIYKDSFMKKEAESFIMVQNKLS